MDENLPVLFIGNSKVIHKINEAQNNIYIVCLEYFFLLKIILKDSIITNIIKIRNIKYPINPISDMISKCKLCGCVEHLICFLTLLISCLPHKSLKDLTPLPNTGFFLINSKAVK